MEQAGQEWLEQVGLAFSNASLLTMAFTHRSYVRENPEAGRDTNERLEFLGDTVLGFVVSDHLYHFFPEFTEGELSKAKAVAVSEPILCEAARIAGLGPHILMSRAEEAAGGRDRPSILSDTFEAIVAAIYLDQGVEAARAFILRFLRERTDAIARHEHEQDFKTALQEVVQAEGLPAPTYRIVQESGPDHHKMFAAQAKVGRKLFGRGTGRSKKEAEQAAARDALERRAAQPKQQAEGD